MSETTPTVRGAFDAAWKSIGADPKLERARSRISLDDIKRLIDHCASSFGAVTLWRSMDTLPEDGGPAKNQDWPGITVLAGAADGRVIQVRPGMLRSMLKPGAPQHLQFPAIGWMPCPPPPQQEAIG